MSERILTLFGEEYTPEPQKPAPKPRGRKKAEKTETPAEPEGEQAPEANNVAAPMEPADAQPVAEAEVVTEAQIADEQAEEEIAAPTPEEKPATGRGRKKITEPNPENLPADWEGNKQYYAIGEVADLFKVKTSHIRFWTNEFKLKVRTNRKGDRLYTTEQIKELRAIHHLVKERGFTLAGAKAKLKEQKNRDVHTIDLKKSLIDLREKLVAIKKQLK